MLKYRYYEEGMFRKNHCIQLTIKTDKDKEHCTSADNVKEDVALEFPGQPETLKGLIMGMQFY